MHVAINALSLTNRSGTGRYTWGLIHGFIQWAPPDFFLSVLIPSQFPIPPEWYHSTQARFYSIPMGGTGQRIVWEQGFLPAWLKKIRPDILHSPAFIAPVMRSVKAKQIVTVHDLAFCRYPQTIPWARRWYYAWAVPASMRRADVVLTDTRIVADEIRRCFPAIRRVIPIPLGVDTARFQPRPSDYDQEILARYQIHAPYLLFVGTREPRKNLDTLLQAYAEARRQGLNAEFVIAGRLGWMMDETSLPGVRLPGHVEEDAVPALYRHARAVIAPSLYEGFDLPASEALACGAPVLASDIPVHREVLGDRVQYVSPESIQEWTKALLRLEIKSPTTSCSGVRDWTAVARDTRHVYQMVLE
ncbi:MAG TPA: glycosyltransferase family 1 protein [bacterium]|nr:glycosyltransferase family 4 protein [Candidatus Omnitrophota bacterium]HOL94796.1 glycosyltransferase family 1 protein [bacterium]